MKILIIMGILMMFFVSDPIFCAMDAPSFTGPVPQLFISSGRCMACHNGLRTPSGQDVSIGLNWQSSMMANSSRDPYWQAAVRRETLEHPKAKAPIQDECAACHMPMARYQAHAQGMKGAVFPLLPGLPKSTPGALLAADGVSCTLCHQITALNLGTRKSFTAGFEVDVKNPFGQRLVFGPFTVDSGRKRVMESSGRFVPGKGLHIQESALCGSCHTLYTHTLDPDGNVIGRLPEQVPYLEWRHSGYRGHASCQSCHMPQISPKVPISSVLGVPRNRFSRHAFRGGNFFMLNMLERYNEPLAVKARPASLTEASRETREHLLTEAARIEIERVIRSKGYLKVLVGITNLAGHKLPTAYPSRRTWIHLTVKDDMGHVLFESGFLKPDGAIAGNDNDRDPALFEPHYTRIENAEQVQIYEAVMVDVKDNVTTGLLSAIRFVKDNRILPKGFHKETAERDIAVQGRASKDADFQGGKDRICYVVSLEGAQGPFTITAKLRYQPIGYRWAHNLGLQKAPEIDRFITYYEAMSNGSAIVLAKAIEDYED